MTTENNPTELSQPPAGRWVGGLWTTGDAAERTAPDSTARSDRSGEVQPGAGLKIPFRIEWSIYAGLVFIALAMRLYDLGGRAIHHDESLHGYFAYQLFIGGGYEHNPLMHGMFQFYSIVASFFLIGDSDFSLRLPMALFGTGLVLVPLLLRPRIGQVGALVAALMLAFSPSMLYFSRFARNDIFMAVFTLALVGVMWRYLDEKKNRWLYIGAGLIALGFTTKETQYIVIALLGAYLVTQVWRELRDWIYARKTLRDFSPGASFLVLLVTISLPLGAAGIALFQDALGVTLAAADGIPKVPPGSPNGSMQILSGWEISSLHIAIGVSAALLAAALTTGWYWNRKVFLGAWAIFAFIFVMLFSNFGSNPVGVGTGAWQSLGYWLAQQEVARGSQPWYYYFTIGAVYEFLPFVVAGAAMVYYGFRSGFRPFLLILGIVAGMAVLANYSLSFHKVFVMEDGMRIEKDALTLVGNLALLAVYASAIGIPFALKTSKITRFLIFWMIGTFIVYTQAGEKMPWLLVNISLPAIILAARIINDIVMSIDWSGAVRSRAWFALVGVPIFYLLLWKIVFDDLGQGGRQFASAWVILTGLGLLLLGLQVLASRIGRSQAFGIIGLVSVVLLFGLTFRAGWVANYQNGDIPREMLVYTQTSPDLHELAKEIEQAAQLTGDRSDIKLVIDTKNAFAWPWQWYLRHYTQALLTDHSSDKVVVGEDRLIAIISVDNNARVKASLPDGFSDGRKLVHRWWFPEIYRGLTPETFFATIIDRDRWKGSIDYFFFRKLSSPLGTTDSFVYFSDRIPLAPVK